MDRVENTLTAHFSVDAAPEGLARRILEMVREPEREARGLIDKIEITATDAGISLIRAERLPPPSSAKARRLVGQAREELGEYLTGRRTFFSVPVDLSASPSFQRDVLEAARGIPFGEVRSYAWVARRIGRPRAVRAVGTALGKNPVPLIVPCHRVLRSDGGLGGYLFGLALKGRLVALERTTPTLIGCATTQIVCRRGCGHEQRVGEDRRVIFASVADARSVGYRPCKVCRPAA
jgi:O-6-methylguanine DNA methyltransferase